MSLTVHPSDRANLPCRIAGQLPTHRALIVTKTCLDANRFNLPNSKPDYERAKCVGRVGKRDSHPKEWPCNFTQ